MVGLTNPESSKHSVEDSSPSQLSHLPAPSITDPLNDAFPSGTRTVVSPSIKPHTDKIGRVQHGLATERIYHMLAYSHTVNKSLWLP